MLGKLLHEADPGYVDRPRMKIMEAMRVVKTKMANQLISVVSFSVLNPQITVNNHED